MVTTIVRTATHTANGATTSFAYPFLISVDGDLNVYVDGVLTTSGFTITGEGEEAGGAVVFSVAPVNTTVILLERDVPLTQPTNFPKPSLDPEQMEKSFDRLTIQLQDRETLRTMESSLAASFGVVQAGTTGTAMVFTNTGAPTMTLTEGTWYLNGSVTARTSDIADSFWATFYDNTDTVQFGGSGAEYSDNTREEISVSGFITIPAGESHVIYFALYPVGASTLDAGSASPDGPAGYMSAIRIG